MSENFGEYLGEIRKAKKSSILDMTHDEWQTCCDYAARTGHMVSVGSRDDISVDGVPTSIDAIERGLQCIEDAEEAIEMRQSLY
jgi:hypothetical protein